MGGNQGCAEWPWYLPATAAENIYIYLYVCMYVCTYNFFSTAFRENTAIETEIRNDLGHIVIVGMERKTPAPPDPLVFL